jgi:mannosyl-oligosaccharide alpha-1,3-glucosidase
MVQSELLDVSGKMIEKSLPCDAVWLDIEYADKRRYFTWNKQAFPDPSEMLKQVKANGQRLVTIIDPHIAKDETYWLFQQGLRANCFVLDKTGLPYAGHCWPGASHWLDFMNPDVTKLLTEIYTG